MIYIKYSYDEIKFAFAKSLKELRLYTGLTLKDLEKLTQINNPSLSRYENGKVEPSLSQAVIIADIFKLTTEDFIIFGLGEEKENCKYKNIIDYFNMRIANLTKELGKNGEKLLQQLFPKIDINAIKKDYI